MAVERLAPSLPYWPVAVWLPDEREGQVLGGTQGHLGVAQQLCLALENYSRRWALGWLVRQEGQLLYPRLDGTQGSFYPDGLVAPGVHLADPALDAYDVAAVGKPPELIVEVGSKATRRNDRGPKVDAYAQVGVGEYVIFDPRPRKRRELLGYRLARPGQYAPIAPAPEGGLWLAAEGPLRAGAGPLLRLFTPDGERLLHTGEEAEARIAAERTLQAAERTLRAEREGRLVAEARLAELAALLARTEAPGQGG